MGETREEGVTLPVQMGFRGPFVSVRAKQNRNDYAFTGKFSYVYSYTNVTRTRLLEVILAPRGDGGLPSGCGGTLTSGVRAIRTRVISVPRSGTATVVRTRERPRHIFFLYRSVARPVVSCYQMVSVPR